MIENKIRPLALAIIRNDNRILVIPGYDPKKDEHFYRLVGGGIEFGETALEALRREFKEELNLELEAPELLDVVENIFTFDNKKGHEVVFVYEAKFSDHLAYLKEEMIIIDHPQDSAIWLDLAQADLSKIYPTGLDKYLS